MSEPAKPIFIDHYQQLAAWRVTDSKVSDEHLQVIKHKIDGLPKNLINILVEQEYKIVIPRILTDFYISHRNKPYEEDGAGWNAKKRNIKTFDQVKGVHDSREDHLLVFPEYYIDADTGKESLIKKIRYNVFHHEIGHAIDYCLGNDKQAYYSLQSAFKHRCVADLASLTKEEENLLDYNLNHPNAVKEIFADIISEHLRSESEIIHLFPRCYGDMLENIFPHIIDAEQSPAPAKTA